MIGIIAGGYVVVETSFEKDVAHRVMNNEFPFPFDACLKKLVAAEREVNASLLTWFPGHHATSLDDFKRQQAGLVHLLITECFDPEGVQKYDRFSIPEGRRVICTSHFDLIDDRAKSYERLSLIGLCYGQRR